MAEGQALGLKGKKEWRWCMTQACKGQKGALVGCDEAERLQRARGRPAKSRGRGLGWAGVAANPASLSSMRTLACDIPTTPCYTKMERNPECKWRLIELILVGSNQVGSNQSEENNQHFTHCQRQTECSTWRHSQTYTDIIVTTAVIHMLLCMMGYIQPQPLDLQPQPLDLLPCTRQPAKQ